MMRRLIRIRTSTEAFSYKLSDKVDHTNYPKNYIFFKGQMIQKTLEEFLKENQIVIQ